MQNQTSSPFVMEGDLKSRFIRLIRYSERDRSRTELAASCCDIALKLGMTLRLSLNFIFNQHTSRLNP